MPELSPNVLAEALDALRRRRAMLLSLAAETEHELSAVALGAVPAGTADAAAADVGRLVARLDDRGRREMGAIDAAIDRLQSGRYGQCERCNGDIELPRLRAVPTTTACAGCGPTHCAEEEHSPELSMPTGATRRLLLDTAERRRSARRASGTRL